MSDQTSGAAPAADAPSPLAGVGVVVIVAIAIIGWAVFGETLGLQKIAAIGLIAAGVAMLATTA